MGSWTHTLSYSKSLNSLPLPQTFTVASTSYEDYSGLDTPGYACVVEVATVWTGLVRDESKCFTVRPPHPPFRVSVCHSGECPRWGSGPCRTHYPWSGVRHSASSFSPRLPSQSPDRFSPRRSQEGGVGGFMCVWGM